jgi:poly(3-hydroxybutyrate) depolymerase
MAFIRKTMDEVLGKYNVDRTRVVAHGYQAGGAMGYLLAFSHLDVIRAVAAIDAPLPLRAQIPANDPIHRLEIYSALPSESSLSERITAGAKRLTDAKFPVVVRKIDGNSRDLNDNEFIEMSRWIDTLDRI